MAISYSGNYSLPCRIIVKDAEGNSLSRTDYTFSGSELRKVEEYGFKNGEPVLGQNAEYKYESHANRTVVTYTFPADAGGNGVGLVFRKGEIVRKVDEKNLVEELFKEIDAILVEEEE